ncbi:hypothetical protein V5799_003234 [Amblyomma americanum]|uniref:Uncharacterized protein n=1 Tax=Amblyomma americanum TaxID=6943 RepID=A0AAQ4D9J6_AMBAM
MLLEKGQKTWTQTEETHTADSAFAEKRPTAIPALRHFWGCSKKRQRTWRARLQKACWSTYVTCMAQRLSGKRLSV